MSRAGRLVRGVAALLALVALLVVVPLFLIRAVGNPWPGRDAVQLRDEREILLGLLAAAAWVVWARFAVAVVSESVLQVRELGADRSDPRGRTDARTSAAPPRLPAGGGIGLLASRLVAVALTMIPLTQMPGPDPVPLPFRPAPAAAAAAVTSVAVPAPPSPAAAHLPLVEVQGNDSLFRIAERHLGDRGRWREILELNTGRVQADGGRLTTPSSLRGGWTLLLPADAAPQRAWTPRLAAPHPAGEPTIGATTAAQWEHVVTAGESYWEIAARQLQDEHGSRASAAEISARAAALITANATRLGYSDPTMLHPGDVVVGDRAPASVAADGHTATYVVAPGDSYWDIAGDHLRVTLGRPPTDGEVLAATEALIETNAPLFAYADPALLHPGDELILPATQWPPPAPAIDPAPGGRAATPPAVTPPTRPVAPPAAPPSTEVPSVEVPSAEVPSAEPPAAQRVDTPPPAARSLGPSRGEAVPVTGPPDTTQPDYGDLLGTPRPDGRSLVAPIGLGGAVLLAGGVVGLLDARRRSALRRARARARLGPVVTTPVESRMRALDAPARLVRLDLVLRALAVALRGQRSQPLVALAHRDGTVALRLSADATLPAPWLADADGWWTMPGTIEEEDLAVLARSCGLPCPAIAHLGTSAGADVFVDLEAVGILDVDGPAAAVASIIDAIALGLAVSPFASGATLTMVGVDERVADARDDVELGFDVGQATATARAMLGTIGATASMGTTTFGLRARSTVERWEPVVVLLGPGVTAGDDLRGLARPEGHGVALVTAAASTGAATLHHDETAGWVLMPWAVPIEPVGISTDDVAAVIDLLDEADGEFLLPPDPASPPDPDVDVAEYEDREWELLVRTLGAVRVHDGAGTDVRFERSKAQELVCWLALHRTHATRRGARTALWDTDVRDATFANVVSDARRSMARLASPPEGQEWIGRTLTESLPLHPLIVTDADLLADRVAAARAQPPATAISLLRPGLALVTDLPFAGTGYLWPDTEGSVTELVLLGTTAAVEMGEHCLATGDVEGVFWATGQGLRILPGHEELVALRMRAHARAGDLAAVRAEWGSYERALAADTWSDPEPAPKLVELRRELLGPAPVGGA